jgi:hypothetical protein
MTIAEEILSSPNNLRISAVTYIDNQLGYIRRCPGRMGCKTCLGLIRMLGDSGSFSSSSYSLECNCRCHNGPGGVRKTHLNFQGMKGMLEAANLAELKRQEIIKSKCFSEVVPLTNEEQLQLQPQQQQQDMSAERLDDDDNEI